jgi:hypothetical protein
MRPPTSTVRRALLAAAVAAIVLGIIGMHALTTHGVMAHTDDAAMSMTTGSHTDMSAQATVGDPTDVRAGVPDEGNDTGTMVMLCVAMLASAAGALLLLLVCLRRIPRLWVHLPTPSIAVTRWVTARLGTGPPPVWQFSVIRC